MSFNTGGAQRVREAAPLLGLGLILVAAQFVYWGGARDSFGIPKMMCAAVGVVILWSDLLWRAFKSETAVVWHGADAPLLVCAAVLGASTYYSMDRMMSIVGPHAQQYCGIVPLGLCVLTFLATRSLSSGLSFDIPLLAVIGSIPVSAIAVAQHFTDRVIPWSAEQSGSTYGSGVFMGCYLAVVMPLAWDRRKTPLGAAALLSIVGALLAAHSRGGLASGIAGIMFYEYLSSACVSA